MAVDPVTWGRKAKAEWTNTLGALAMITFFPALIIFYWIALESHGGSVTAAFRSLAASNNPWSMFWARCPQPSMTAAVGYVAWLIFQIVLYFALPGPDCLGQRTPGGNILTYRCNGLAAYIFTHGQAGVLIWFGVINPAIIANNWEGLLVAVNVYGMALALAAQVKGYMSPSYPEDQKLTGLSFPSAASALPADGEQAPFSSTFSQALSSTQGSAALISSGSTMPAPASLRGL